MTLAVPKQAALKTKKPERTEAPPVDELDADTLAPQKPGGIQSLERGFAILEEVARHQEGIGLAELSRRIGLHNSTTFHLIKTMVALGYIRQNKDNKLYRVGRPLFGLATSAFGEIEMLNAATPVLERLAEATGEGTHFAVPTSHSVMIIARVAGGGAFQMSERAGLTRPMHCTALGKVMLAAMSDDQLKRYLETETLTPNTPKSIIDPERLHAEIMQIRKSGVGYDDGEFNMEVRCVAVPVFDFAGRTAGAIGLSGPMWRLSIASMNEKLKDVHAAAAALSADFGARNLLAD